MNEFIRVMKALSDKNRLKVLKMLQHRELCVCEIQKGLGQSQPTVSKNLKLLEEAGLVISRKDGPWVNYSLNTRPGTPYASSILGNLRFWFENDPEIQRLVDKLPELNRETICN